MDKRLVLIGLLAVVTAVPGFAQDDEAAAEEEAKKLWENKLGLAFVKNTGNSETQTFGLNYEGTREPTPWGLQLRAYYNSAEDSGVETAEQYYLGARALRKLGERWDAFFGLSGARDEFAGYKLQLIAETGVTYHALMGPRHFLSFDGGLTYTDEDRIVPNPDVSYLGGILGLDYEYKFSDNASFTQAVDFYPNFDDSDDWRVFAETGLTASITDLLGLKLGYIYRYRNQPIGDAKSTDTTTTMSVVMNF
jgi:putative salt-induced outer membrane protein